MGFGLVLWMTASACTFDPTGASFATDGDSAADASTEIGPLDAAPPAPDASAPIAATVTVPGSQYLMGCPADEIARCRADERPARLVMVDAFAIDRTEVTRARYTDCVADGACSPPHCEADPTHGPDLPVVCVTWNQAHAYCAWTGARLPTEAEWEKAARGETSAWYPWGDDAPRCEHANFAQCGSGLDPAGRHPAGASAYGALDLAGNAFEWVADWYEPDYYDGGPSFNPSGPPVGQERVARGGSFLFDSYYMRASLRSRDDPQLWFDDLGFRCARSL